MPPHVIFLKDRGAGQYEAALPEYETHHVGLLDTETVNSKTLRRLITSGPGSRFSGVVLTSARASQAWESAAETGTSDSWSGATFYAVGEATRESVYRVFGRGVRVVMGAGTGEELAQTIVADRGETEKVQSLLVLTGDKNRDALRDILTENDVPHYELQVYATSFREAARHEWAEVLALTHGVTDTWIVFFSPSGVDFYMDYLRPLSETPSRPPRCATIGTVTARHLEQKYAIIPLAVASEPTPQSLASSLREKDQRYPSP